MILFGYNHKSRGKYKIQKIGTAPDCDALGMGKFDVSIGVYVYTEVNQLKL